MSIHFDKALLPESYAYKIRLITYRNAARLIENTILWLELEAVPKAMSVCRDDDVVKSALPTVFVYTAAAGLIISYVPRCLIRNISTPQPLMLMPRMLGACHKEKISDNECPPTCLYQDHQGAHLSSPQQPVNR